VKKYHYRFDNVLSIREMERSETEIEYQAAIDRFEVVATELYQLLKRKEETIEEQTNAMEKGASVLSIHHYMNFIESLEKKIEQLQQEVMKARTSMQWHEQKLLERTVEVKKYEKMKEKDVERFNKEMNQLEAKHLDELSMTAVFGKENG